MNGSYMTLKDVSDGATVKIKELLTKGSMRRRFMDIGIIEGTDVKCLNRSPMGDPVAYLIRGAVIAIRSEDSETIIIE
ncbi:MAG: FeoA family protein [Lachnospiraceae bacterium]|nr:FeoA family protein [Lachnospiraceae bacterium]